MKVWLGLLVAAFAPALVLAEPSTPVADPPAQSQAEPPPAPAEPPKEAPEPSSVAPTAASGSAGPTGLPTVTHQTPEAEAARTGWNLGLDLDNSVGSGTFDNPSTSALVTTSLVISPTYAFRLKGVKLSASARGMLSWEYTLPDNEAGRRLSLWDSRLGLAAPALFVEKHSGIAVTPSVGAIIPTSMESRLASMLTALSAAASFSRTLDRVDLLYRVSVSKGVFFNTQSLASKSNQRDLQGNLTYLGRVNEDYAASNGNNLDWSVANSVGVTYRFTENLSASGNLTLVNSWKYAVTDSVDPYTPKALDSNGNPVARVGDGRSDRLVGALGVSYALSDTFGVSAGVSTNGPPKTRDNRSFRFPFFDFVSANDNLTTYSLSLSAYF